MHTVETSTIQEVADITGLGYQTIRNKWKHGEIEGYQRVKNAPIQLFNESWQKLCPQKSNPAEKETFEPVEVEYGVSDQVSMEEISVPEKRSHAGKKNGWKRIEGRISPEREAWVEEVKEKWGIKKDCDFLDAIFDLAQSTMAMMKYASVLSNSNNSNNGTSTK